MTPPRLGRAAAGARRGRVRPPVAYTPPVAGEPTLATTGPRIALTDHAAPGFFNGDTHPFSPTIVGGVITYTGIRWTGSSAPQVYGSGTSPVPTKYRFVDCDFPNGVSTYGSLPAVEFVYCSFGATIGSGTPSGLVDHCQVQSRSTCIQYVRELTDNSPGGSHATPWLVQDSVLWVMGPLTAGTDHSEVLHVGVSSGSDGFQAVRNSMRIPVNPSTAGNYTDGITGLCNFDSLNANAVLDSNWFRAYTGANLLYFNGTNMQATNNRIYLASLTSPQAGGGAGATPPTIYNDVNTVKTGRVVSGNVWLNDGAAISGW